MDSSAILVLVVVLIVAASLTTYLLLKKITHDESSDIDEKWLSSKFSGDGLFVTNLDTTMACPNYLNSVSSDFKCVEPEGCKSPVDVSDFKVLNNLLAAHPYPPCFNVALSWIGAGAAQITYGPATYYSDFNIGLFLDFDILKNYIACAKLTDAGTQGLIWKGKLALDTANLNAAKQITAEQLSDDSKLMDLINVCNGQDTCGLYFTGCGSIPSGNPLSTSTKTYSGYNFTAQFSDVIDRRVSKNIPAGWYAFQPSFNRINWDEYTKYVRDYHKDLALQADPTAPPDTSGTVWKDCMSRSAKYGATPVAQTACGDHWSYFFDDITAARSNGFRETEVDLFVPQKPGAGGKMGADDTYYPGKCDPTDDFVKAWRAAILGVYVLPNHCGYETRGFHDDNPSPNSRSCCDAKKAAAMASNLAKTINDSLAANDIVKTVHAWVWESAERMDARWNPSADFKLKLIS